MIPDRRFDSPDMLPLIGGLIVALVVALAVFGLVNLDDTEQRQPLAPPVYGTLEVTP